MNQFPDYESFLASHTTELILCETCVEAEPMTGMDQCADCLTRWLLANPDEIEGFEEACAITASPDEQKVLDRIHKERT